MDKYQEKYGIIENEKTIEFHKSRRMFCILDNTLHIAEPNLPYSHAVWFEKEGWMTPENDKLMSTAIRGIIDEKGDVYFYIGYDFGINKQAEELFFPHLKELVDKLSLNPESKVFGGLVKQKSGEQWPPIKEYGTVKELL